MFELHTEPAPPGLAPLGQVVELRELAYGPMREAMSNTTGPGQSAERLLGASLHVDGAPYGYDALRGLPGRFSQAIANALEQTLRMHGLEVTVEAPTPPAEGVGGADGSDASEGPKA
ncbi:MAG TPA: hypothetical protein VN680_02475 [Burkholderiaceae bacterium]|nr:hypothetical protein [Burkholderiaceae bacterium]